METILSGVTFTAAGVWGPTVSSVTLPGAGAPVKITCSGAHGLSTGNRVAVSGTSGVTGLNATWPVTVISTTEFTLDGSGTLVGSPSGSPAVALEALDISGITDPDPVLFVRFEGLTAGKKVVFAIEDTVDNFSAAVQRYTFSIAGPVSGPDVTRSIAARDFPMHRLGVTSAKMRLRCLAIDSAASVKVSAWVSE